jgi:hypothetical protein
MKMKYLTKQEWENEYLDNKEIGNSFFMGGFGLDCKSKCVHAGNEIVYFDENDILVIQKYREMMDVQTKESEDYTKDLE